MYNAIDTSLQTWETAKVFQKPVALVHPFFVITFTTDNHFDDICIIARMTDILHFWMQ